MAPDSKPVRAEVDFDKFRRRIYRNGAETLTENFDELDHFWTDNRKNKGATP